MVLERIPWTCTHGCPLRLLALSLYLWGAISEELGAAWEIAGRPRPEGYIAEFRGCQFVHGYEKTGFLLRRQVLYAGRRAGKGAGMKLLILAVLATPIVVYLALIRNLEKEAGL